MNIYGYDFEGPYNSPDQVPEYPGVYTVWCSSGGILLDVGQAENVQERLKYHDRKDCWEKYCSEPLHFYVTKEPDEIQRCSLESKIRIEHNPPCGKK